MRVSTSTLYELGVASVQQREAAQLKLQQQIAAGRRMLTPADDPIAAASALQVGQAQSVNEQYRVNGDSARAALALEEQALADVTRLLQDVKVLAVNAGNPTLTDQDRLTLATELEGRYQELLGIANRTDGSGQYLFSGYRGTTRPFSEVAAGVVTYAGDQGQRLIRIGPSREIAVSDAGTQVFQRIAEGNRSFVTAAQSTNAGSGVVDTGNVLDAAKWNASGNSKDFVIRFHVDSGVSPPAITYDIVDDANNISLLTGAAPAAGPYLRPYVPGAAISLKTEAPPDTNATPFDYGAEVSVTGTPADGDSFTVRGAGSQDMFATIGELVATLRSGAEGGASRYAQYQNRLNGAMVNLDSALDNVLTMRAAVGIRLREVDTAQSTAEDAGLAYEQDLSRLQDLDYAKALSELNLQQFYLEAAQRSFVKVTESKLFDYL